MSLKNFFIIIIILLIVIAGYLLVTKYYKKVSLTFKNINLSYALGFISLLALVFYGSRKVFKHLDSDSDFRISVVAFDGGEIKHFTQDAFTRKRLLLI